MSTATTTLATPAVRLVRRPRGPVRFGGRRMHDPEDVPVASVQGALALDIDDLSRPPALPELRVVSDQETAHLHRWAGRFAQAVVEAMVGHRPPSQLLRHMTPDVHHDLVRRSALVNERGLRTRPPRLKIPQVRSVHVFLVHAGAAEVSVHVRYGERSRAMAARIEHRGGRWQCTVLEWG